MNISNCLFQNNIFGISYPNNGIIENCILLDNTTAIQGSYTCEIKNNVIDYNELGVNISALTSLTNNQINNNIGGVRISDISSSTNAPIIQNNEICSNINFSVDNNTNVNYSLLSNCFCGLDSTGIEQYLWDGYDDITKGLINYQVYDTTCTTILTTVLKFNGTSSIESTVDMDLSIENPVNNQLHVFSSTPISELTVTDMQGKTYHLNAVETNVYDVSHLSNGFYIITQINQYPVSIKLSKF